LRSERVAALQYQQEKDSTDPHISLLVHQKGDAIRTAAKRLSSQVLNYVELSDPRHLILRILYARQLAN
jgi:hypothetical protein